MEGGTERRKERGIMGYEERKEGRAMERGKNGSDREKEAEWRDETKRKGKF